MPGSTGMWGAALLRGAAHCPTEVRAPVDPRALGHLWRTGFASGFLSVHSCKRYDRHILGTLYSVADQKEADGSAGSRWPFSSCLGM